MDYTLKVARAVTYTYTSNRLQVAARFIVPGRRLPADCGLRTPPATLRSRQRPHCSENKHSTWRQEFLGCGSENL